MVVAVMNKTCRGKLISPDNYESLMSRDLDLESPRKTKFVKNLEKDSKDINSKVSELTKWLYDDDNKKRRTAASRLGDIAKYHPDNVVYACDKLRNLVKTDETRVKVNSLEALIFVGKNNPEEIRSLIGTFILNLYHENAKIRQLAIYGLIVAVDHYPAKVRPAIPRLIELLDDSNTLPQAAAIKAIGKFTLYHPKDVKSEEILSKLNIFVEGELDEIQRGPHTKDEIKKYAREAINNLEYNLDREYVELPEYILDDELRLRVVEHFENKQYQSAVQQSFITLEERIRKKGGYDYEDYGTSLVSEAFHYKNGPLAFGQTESEKRGVMLLYKSAFQTFRNTSSHRFLDNMGPQHAHHIICFVNLLLLFLGPKEK